MFLPDGSICPYCRQRPKSVDHLASQCERMLHYDYTRRRNEVVCCIHLSLCGKYGLKAFPRMQNYKVKKVIANENVEIKGDIPICIKIKVAANRPDIVVHDKKRKEIILLEVGITSQNRLLTVKTEKKRKYDVLANKLGQEYNCKTKIIPYVMTWDGIVTTYHKSYSKEIDIANSVKAYI